MAYNLKDETKTKKQYLRGLHLSELSLVDRGANVDSVVTLAKRRTEEQLPLDLPSKVDPAAQRDALAALDRLIAKVRTEPQTPSLVEVLAKACPSKPNTAQAELEALVQKRMDSLGCGSVEAWDHFAKVEPDLYARAVNGGN